MKANLKTNWIEALRSGRYQQTQGMLRFGDRDEGTSFCCLGVLCDVAGASWPENVPILNGVVMEDEDESYLTSKGLKLVALPDSVQRELASMNDGGKSFTEIADWIEAHL